MKKRIIIIGIVSIFVLTVIGGLIFVFGTFSSCGIPDDIYRNCDVDGNFIEGNSDCNRWSVWRGKATICYNEYVINKVRDSVYFDDEFNIGGKILAVHYKAEYNPETKILTVYMPSLNAVQDYSKEPKPFYFKA